VKDGEKGSRAAQYKWGGGRKIEKGMIWFGMES